MTKQFLMISNPGVADPTAFTLLGASTSRSSENGQTIGRFGSGNKHGVAVCLRHDLAPIVFAGSLRMTFGTTDVKVDTGLNTKTFARVNVKFGGKDRDGRNRSATEDLGFVLEYGAEDWAGMSLALREFVSNSIDRAIEEDENAFAAQWVRAKGIIDVKYVDESVRDEYAVSLANHRKLARGWDSVVVEIVNENQVRAKEGCTRVFIPLNDEVRDFYLNLGKWFLHFSEPHLLNETILPKRTRNLNGRKAAVIYRRGVRVREFESSDVASLFDYNMNDLVMDESRKVDDWRVRNAAAKALRDASSNVLARVIMSFGGDASYWEHNFDSYGLDSDNWGESKEKVAARETAWQAAVHSVLGDNGVLASKDSREGEIAIRKGFNPVSVPDAYVKAASRYGVKTIEKVLSQDDRDGRVVRDADPAALKALDFAWNLVEMTDSANGRDKPDVKTFSQIMQAGAQTLGFYRDGTIYLNSDITGADGNMSRQLLVTALEEVSHHVTGATDQSRDFQDFLLNLIVKIAH